MAAEKWRRFKIWNRWLAVSRQFGCVLIAMDSEAKRKRSMASQAKRGMATQAKKLLFQSGASKFEVSPTQYVATLCDHHLFCGLILQAYFGLVEEHARDVLRELASAGHDISSLIQKNNKPIEDRIDYYPPPNSIEDWGGKLLELLGRSWSDVRQGKASIAEIAVVRTALSHGTVVVTQRMLNRVENVGATFPWGLNETIALDYDRVKDYRDNLRSLARVIADATAAILGA